MRNFWVFVFFAIVFISVLGLYSSGTEINGIELIFRLAIILVAAITCAILYLGGNMGKIIIFSIFALVITFFIYCFSLEGGTFSEKSCILSGILVSGGIVYSLCLGKKRIGG